MDRDQVLAILRAHEPELRAAGIHHVSLFGSVVRGDNRPQSDIDLVADFSSPHLLSLLKFAAMQVLLSDVLGAQVDLSERQHLKPAVRATFDQENILVF